jgi:ketosteroid isomerase-like protein
MFQKTVLVLFALVPFCRGDDKYSKTDAQNWHLDPAGQVELRVRYGDVHILPAQDSQISITYTMHSKHSDFIQKVEPRFEVRGSKATLAIKAPRNGSVDVDLKVPVQTDVYLRLSAGDVTIGPIEGNKDVETHAGDIEVDIARAASYGTVDASTHAGDVAGPFGRPHGWIGKSLKYQGAGPYRLHAHTFAGDITFQGTATGEGGHASQGTDDFESSLKAILDQYSMAYSRKSADQIANLYAEDALYMGSTGKVEGRTSIRASLAKEFADASDRKLSINSLKSDHAGEMGYDYGTYEAGSPTDAEAGKYLLVLKKLQGNWVIVMASATPGAQ